MRGRYSYEYSDFVHGRYSRKNPHTLAALFNAMSVDERLDVYSLNFAQMWYRIWLTAERRELYEKKRAKFAAAWLEDGGEGLRRLVLASSRLQREGGGTRLEFPKGKRLSSREPDLNCAIRETREETGIEKRDYRLLPGLKRRIAYIDMGVRYVNVYYAAVARRHLPVGVDLRGLDQVAEVSEVRWLDIERIRLFDTPDRRLEKTVAPIFRYVKRYARGALLPAHGLSLRLNPRGVPAALAAHAHTPSAPAGWAGGGAPAPPRRGLAWRDALPVGEHPCLVETIHLPSEEPRSNRRRRRRREVEECAGGRIGGETGATCGAAPTVAPDAASRPPLQL